jgi:hypothetical protein
LLSLNCFRGSPSALPPELSSHVSAKSLAGTDPSRATGVETAGGCPLPPRVVANFPDLNAR